MSVVTLSRPTVVYAVGLLRRSLRRNLAWNNGQYTLMLEVVEQILFVIEKYKAEHRG